MYIFNHNDYIGMLLTQLQHKRYGRHIKYGYFYGMSSQTIFRWIERFIE